MAAIYSAMFCVIAAGLVGWGIRLTWLGSLLTIYFEKTPQRPRPQLRVNLTTALTTMTISVVAWCLASLWGLVMVSYWTSHPILTLGWGLLSLYAFWVELKGDQPKK